MASGRFEMKIKRFVQDARIDIADTVRGIAFGLAGNIVKTTPVDTGRARGNWICTMDRVIKEKTNQKDKVGERTLDRIAVQLEGFEAGKTKHIYLSNTLPYIVMLEYGWSQQSPSGMVRTALLNFNGVSVRSLFGS